MQLFRRVKHIDVDADTARIAGGAAGTRIDIVNLAVADQTGRACGAAVEARTNASNRKVGGVPDLERSVGGHRGLGNCNRREQHNGR